MRAIGILSSALAGAVVLAGVVVGVRSIPDVRRYLNMRQM